MSDAGAGKGVASVLGPVLAAVVLVGWLIGGFTAVAVAQEHRFGPTPSPPGAAVYFIDPKDGDTIPTTSIIHFGLKKMGVAPAGSDRPNSGHHHLLIDTELPQLDEPIPSDFNHLHFGAGQTEAEVTLTPGDHTLQMLLGDANHIPHNPPVVSDRIRVHVVDTATAPTPQATAETSPPPPMVMRSPDTAAPSAPAPASPPAAATPTPVPFAVALMKAANDLFSKAPPQEAGRKALLVVDPLIDGVTGAQSAATQQEEKAIIDLVKEKYQGFEIAPFDAASLASSPVVLVGTFTAINNAGVSSGPRDAYRVCLALADLRTNKIISKGVARALPEGVNPTPTPFFVDSPVFAKDASMDGYVKTCQATKPGDTISQAYTNRILAASLIAEGIRAYDGKRYQDALDLYRSALRAPGGDQLRSLNGIYLAYAALHRAHEAKDAFAKVVDYGLSTDRVGIKLLFQPGSTQFFIDQRAKSPYGMWLQTIAERASADKTCMEITGHTSATGSPALNDRLSALRAEYVRDRLDEGMPDLRQRLIANGKGSREMIVGTGKDDASDALDRRVEFKVVPC